MVVAQKHIFFLGGYVHWDYEDKTAIGYCPYIPFVFSFGILLIFWIVVCISLIVCLTVECIGKVIYPKLYYMPKVIIEKSCGGRFFMEQELRFGLDLGRLAILKKKGLGRL